jgi:aminoglycoside phosphotransferase (APT) family kinase protein
MSATDPTMVPLGGGYSGETFLAEMAGERTVVRIYAENRRGTNAAEVDAAVLRLVHGLLPVPDVLEVRRGDGASGAPGLLVTSFLPGTPLDRLLPSAPDGLRRTIGERLGGLLARLAQMPMPRPGLFVDGDLRTEPLPGGDLATFAEQRRAGTALALWPEHEWDALLAVADRAQELLDRVARTCLVHSDLNPKNLLVDPDTLEVTGVLDWEFAHAGMPVTDLGNLLRFERDPAFADAVLGVYTDRVPDATAETLDQARAADLFALVDLAARRDHNAIARRAHDLLLAIARTGDVHTPLPGGAQ